MGNGLSHPVIILRSYASVLFRTAVGRDHDIHEREERLTCRQASSASGKDYLRRRRGRVALVGFRSDCSDASALNCSALSAGPPTLARISLFHEGSRFRR